MKFFYLGIAITILIFSPSGVFAEGNPKGSHFSGLWQGIDSNDGSEAQRSITLNESGSFRLVGQEAYTVGCGGERGLITGTGYQDGDFLIVEDFTLTCFNGLGPFVVPAKLSIDKKIER